jgi:HSP20 family protein
MEMTVLEPMLEFDRFFNRMLASSGVARSSFVPPADIVVTDDEVTVYMDVPGLTADSLEIELEKDVLTVRGERADPYATSEDGQTWQRIERGFGQFERFLRVPYGLDPDAISAGLDNGVLTIRIPKPDTLKPHRVQIKAAGEARQLEGATA